VRRTIIIGTAIAVLVGASAAFAASGFNAYTAKFTFTSTKAGSAKSPVPVGFTQVYTAKGLNGNRAAPLTDLKTSIYGVVSNAKKFPTCSLLTIQNNKNDNVCNPKAEVATGFVRSLLGPGDDGSPNAVDPKTGKPAVVKCNPGLDVWNAGGGKLVFFFTAKSALQCGGLETGSTAPFYGHTSKSGKYLVLDVPQPNFVSTKVAGVPNFYSSLLFENLVWKKGFIASVACSHGKRPYSQTFKAQNYVGAVGGATQSKTVTASAKCS
jgi:hypothetical protein